MDNRNINVTQHVGEVKKGGTVIGVQVVYQGEPVRIPSPEDTQLHRADLARIETYNRWADEFYIKEEGKVLPLFASPYEDDGGRKREDLLQTIRAHQRLLVLGEPGMGKTVALERMVWETTQADEAIVPILVQLLYFQGRDLIELIRVALNETGRLKFEGTKSIHVFLRETKCLILFDGLNETPGKQREQVIGAIANFMREYPEHRYVVTSRSQDELWRKLRATEFLKDAVIVQSISEDQVLRYLQAHLGKKKGQTLYNRLDISLKSLARTPLLLKLIKEAGGGSARLPRNRGELFDKYVMNKLLEREQKLELMEKPELKKKALGHLAFEMQLNHQLSCDYEWAEKVLTEKGFGEKAETILKESQLHGLLIQQILPEKQLLRFNHQSLQEYFVALKLLSEVSKEKNFNFIQIMWHRLKKYDLTTWAKDYWWSESFVQLAGLVSDSDWLVKIVAPSNPWLAWWCIQEGDAVKVSTREIVEARSIKLLQSEKVGERLRAVQTLAKIKNDRVVEPLLNALNDDNQEIVSLSLKALLEMGDSVYPQIENKIKSNDNISRHIALRYLGSQPDNPFSVKLVSTLLNHTMVGVASGEFFMGSNEVKDKQANQDESPKHLLFLDNYWIGRFPVTVSQWRQFFEETGYLKSNQHSIGAEDTPVRYINWEDAMAYCKWLSEKSGLFVTIPSEAEWEKAARGTDERLYPWGNDFDKDKCNTSESGTGNVSPVGKYSPAGDSFFGCVDMAGNVYEWTSTIYMPYPYTKNDGREVPQNNVIRTLRGGSWKSNQFNARVCYRNNQNPDYRLSDYGFRIAVRPPSL